MEGGVVSREVFECLSRGVPGYWEPTTQSA